MQRILVPTDFSKPAGHATDLAFRLALRHGASVQLIHSVDTPAGFAEGGHVTLVQASRSMRDKQALYPEVRKQLGKARAELERISEDMIRRKVKATYHIGSNLAWQDITDMAGNGSMDLIVMGTTGASGLKETMVGSNTQKVVRMARCPVITLRHAAPAKIANVVVLADPTEKKAVNRLPELLAPLTALNAKLHLLYVNTPGVFEDTDTMLERMHGFAKRLEPAFRIHLTDHFSVAEGAISFTRREGMDMIGVLTHGRAGLRGLLNASVAETIVNHSEVPVITLRLD